MLGADPGSVQTSKTGLGPIIGLAAKAAVCEVYEVGPGFRVTGTTIRRGGGLPETTPRREDGQTAPRRSTTACWIWGGRGGG